MNVCIINYKNFERVRTHIVVLKCYIKREHSNSDVSLRSNPESLSIRVEARNGRLLKLIGPNSFRVRSDRLSAIIPLDRTERTNVIVFSYEYQKVGKIILIYDPEFGEEGIRYLIRPVLVRSYQNVEKEEDDLRQIATQKIIATMQLVQWYYSEKFVEEGFPRFCFEISYEFLEYITALTPMQIKEQTLDELWAPLSKEITSWEHYNMRHKYVFFILHRSKETFNTDRTPPKSAMAAGNMVLLGSDIFDGLPCEIDKVFSIMDDETIIPEHHSLDRMSDRDKTAGDRFSISLGAVAHELGHAFHLGHSKDGVMGKQYHCFSLSLEPKMVDTIGTRTNNVIRKDGSVALDRGKFRTSSLALMSINPWFTRKSLPNNMAITMSGIELSSPNGLVALEVRHAVTGNVTHEWSDYFGQSKCYKKILHETFFPTHNPLEPFEVLAADWDGGFLRKIVTLKDLASGDEGCNGCRTVQQSKESQI